MTHACDMVTEEMWEQGVKQLVGKQVGHRVLVWVNYDMISMHKVFFIAEKESTGSARVTQRDFPLPVFYDEKTLIATDRLSTLNKAVTTMSFEEFPMVVTDFSDDGGYGDDEWYGGDGGDGGDQKYDGGDDTGDEEYDRGDEEYDRGDDEDDNESMCSVSSDVEEENFEEEKQEDPKVYLERQFEHFLQEMDEYYHPAARQAFEQRIEDMVEALRTQKNEF